MTFIDVPHWRDAETREWAVRWRNFHPSELCSPDTKALKISMEFLDALQTIRRQFGLPMHITSGYRTPAHNARIGGVKNSQHVKGLAADVALGRAEDGPVIERLAKAAGMTGIGRYPSRRFIHLDMRAGRNAAWGKW